MIGMALFAVLLSMNFTACSEDNGSTEGDGVVAGGKKLAKLVIDTNDYSETYTFSYDSKGRLINTISIFEREGERYTSDYQLIWGDDAIKISERYGKNVDYYTATLNKGLVQRMDVNRGDYDNYCIMTYTQSKRLGKGVEKDGYEVNTIWDGDKLMSISEDGCETSFTCQETQNKGYFPFYSMLMDIIKCDVLYMAHPELCGMRTTQLPASWTITNRNETETNNATYEFDKDGYISKMNIKLRNGVNTFILDWE